MSDRYGGGTGRLVRRVHQSVNAAIVSLLPLLLLLLHPFTPGPGVGFNGGLND